MRSSLLAIFCIIYLGAFAQRGTDILQTVDSLTYVGELPEDLLSTKTLVLVKVPDSGTSPKIRGDWQGISEIIQPGFKKAGIDAVAYYFIDDVFSGPEVVTAFAENFEERQLTNIVFLLERNGQFELIITTITDKNNLITPGQKAWKITGSDLKKMAHNLYLKAAGSSQDRKNLLIIEVPTFGDMAQPITARRGEYFDVNFSSEPLAVPAFADTSQIKRVMAKYPYEYEIVDPALTEKELRNSGFQYVLYHVHTIGKNTKKILEYPTTESETVYISEVTGENQPKVKSININTPVYKFYIKHIYSENVFLGTKWDADTTWWDALDNYVTNLKNQLVSD